MAGTYTFAQKALVLTFFFISGACTAVLGNVMYNTNSIGNHNVVKPFQKPWFQGWAMFVAMSSLIFATPFAKNCACPSYKIGQPIRGWGLLRMTSVPALCDMSATILQNIALLFLPPSVWQMTRGSILLFTAFFSIFYRHHKLNLIDWIGILFTILGISLVGIAAVTSDNSSNKSSSGKTIVSMCLIFIAQGLQAFQTIVEEQLLHDIDATENEIVSYEGIWGLYFSTFIMMPLAQIAPSNWGEGLYEDSIESFKLIANSYTIFFLLLGYLVAILVYNLTGMIVTLFSSAIHRNIYEALRSAAVWVLSLIVYRLNNDAGEKLSWPSSFIQLIGFSVSILGSFVYNRVVKFSCLKDSNEATNEVNSEPLMSNNPQ